MGCDECNRLRAQVRELKEELAEWETGASWESQNTTEVDLIRVRFRVRPQPAKIIAALLMKPGKTVSIDLLMQMADCGGSADDERPPSRSGPIASLRVSIARAREALSAKGVNGAIINIHGRGYTMPVQQAEQIEEIIRGLM